MKKISLIFSLTYEPKMCIRLKNKLATSREYDELSKVQHTNFVRNRFVNAKSRLERRGTFGKRMKAAPYSCL